MNLVLLLFPVLVEGHKHYIEERPSLFDLHCFELGDKVVESHFFPSAHSIKFSLAISSSFTLPRNTHFGAPTQS